jgi:hypothetical protein
MNSIKNIQRLLGIIACIILIRAEAAIPLEELFYKGKAIPFYGDSTAPQQTQLLEALKKSRMAERMATLTQSSLRLRKR